MKSTFKARGLPALIGSLPLRNHVEACQLVLEYTPQIPLWIQLPAYKEEGMVPQFMPGLPGICSTAERTYIDTAQVDFENNILKFYEDYMAVADGASDLSTSRFSLNKETARGFFVFLEQLKACASSPVGLKGQVTGPITFGLGVADHSRRARI